MKNKLKSILTKDKGINTTEKKKKSTVPLWQEPHWNEALEEKQKEVLRDYKAQEKEFLRLGAKGYII